MAIQSYTARLSVFVVLLSPTHSPLILEPSRITPHLPGARPHTLFEQAI